MFFLICGGFVLFLTNYILVIEYYDIRGYFKICFKDLYHFHIQINIDPSISDIPCSSDCNEK